MVRLVVYISLRQYEDALTNNGKIYVLNILFIKSDARGVVDLLHVRRMSMCFMGFKAWPLGIINMSQKLIYVGLFNYCNRKFICAAQPKGHARVLLGTCAYCYRIRILKEYLSVINKYNGEIRKEKWKAIAIYDTRWY